MSTQEGLSRRRPAVVLVFVAVLLVIHHWWAVTQGSAFIFAILILPMLAAISLAGLIDPAIYWTITPKAKELPLTPKILAGVAALIGLIAGVYFAHILYDVP